MGFLALALAAALGAPLPAAVEVSSHAAGARPVALTLRLSYDMVCRYPGPGPVTIRLPAAERVPRRLARSAVLVDGKPARGVRIAGRTVTVALPPKPPILCMSISRGTLVIRFTRAAGLGNPARPGSYAVAARRRGDSFAGSFTVGGR